MAASLLSLKISLCKFEYTSQATRMLDRLSQERKKLTLLCCICGASQPRGATTGELKISSLSSIADSLISEDKSKDAVLGCARSFAICNWGAVVARTDELSAPVVVKGEMAELWKGSPSLPLK